MVKKQHQYTIFKKQKNNNKDITDRNCCQSARSRELFPCALRATQIFTAFAIKRHAQGISYFVTVKV